MTPAAILALRRQLQLTQEQFAHRLGTTVATVNRWERGKVRPSPLAVAALAALAAAQAEAQA